MTLFEYLAAGYVLMLSFAVLRAVAGVPHALRADARYWVHVAWLFAAILLCLISFLAFWPYREVDWTSFKFIIVLSTPIMLYAFTSLLVPADPSTVTSWRDHFFHIRIPAFVIGAALLTSAGLSNQVVLGVPPLHPSQLGNYFGIGLFLTGLASAKAKVHAGLALFPIVLAAYFLVLLSQPGLAFHTAP